MRLLYTSTGVDTDLFSFCRDIKPANVLISTYGGGILMDLGSMDEAHVMIHNSREAQKLQDDAAERCTMPYRAPELFNVQTGDTVTQSTDMWVGLVRWITVVLSLPHCQSTRLGLCHGWLAALHVAVFSC